jgi:hypothetical protein
VIAVREVDSSYNVPLGVWVVREAAKKAMKNRKKASLDEIRAMLGPIKSKVIDFHTKQKKLFQFL